MLESPESSERKKIIWRVIDQQHIVGTHRKENAIRSSQDPALCSQRIGTYAVGQCTTSAIRLRCID